MLCFAARRSAQRCRHASQFITVLCKWWSVVALIGEKCAFDAVESRRLLTPEDLLTVLMTRLRCARLPVQVQRRTFQSYVVGFISLRPNMMASFTKLCNISAGRCTKFDCIHSHLCPCCGVHVYSMGCESQLVTGQDRQRYIKPPK